MKALRGAAALLAFAAAVGFFWGGAEALLNRWRPPAATWSPDFLLVSWAGRAIFYAAAAAALTLLGAGVGALAAVLRRKPAREGGRGWRGAVAVAAVVAANAGWLVLGSVEKCEVNVHFFTLDIQEAAPFFGFWAFFFLVGAAAALALAFGLSRRRWWRAAGRYVRLAGVAGFVVVLAACYGPRALRPRPRGPNVVLIVLDAWRGDRFRLDLMPYLYSYAEENALVFSRAWTNATWTRPAMATMFTGQYPDTNGMRQRPEGDKYSPTVAQALRAAGYETTAFVANRILNRDCPVTDGFENYYFSDWLPVLRILHFYDTNWYGPAVRGLFHGPPSSEDTRILSRMLRAYLKRSHRRPYFLWVHYMDPHGPYKPPPGYYRPEDEKYILDYRPWARPLRYAYKRLYDGECMFVDDQLAPILARLAREPRTVVIVTADHGEEFWEHGKYCFGHGKSVYDTLTRIPLIVSLPDTPPARVETPVSLVDLGPTVLTLCGQEPLATMQGEPFLRADGRPVARNSPVFIGSGFFRVAPGKPQRRDAVVLWPYKLILPHRKNRAPGRYYNLARDPSERRLLRRDELAGRLRRALAAWKEAQLQARYEPDAFGGAAAPDLRALGYIH